MKNIYMKNGNVIIKMENLILERVNTFQYTIATLLIVRSTTIINVNNFAINKSVCIFSVYINRICKKIKKSEKQSII